MFPAFVYLHGWLDLRATSSKTIEAWRAGSFLIGLFLIWVAMASPLADLDHEFLTVHMIQHLLLMTFAAPLTLLGEPMMLLWSGLRSRPEGNPNVLARRRGGQPEGMQGHRPRAERFVRHPGLEFMRENAPQRGARIIFCWLAATAALVVWHIPAAFALGMRSHAWHVFEQASFFTTGLLFWWPVVQPWPSARKLTDWSIILYLFLATLPCDILSGFLVFSERVAYPVYLSTSDQSSLTVLADQQCAGALMWTCVTIVYLVAAAILSIRLLSPQNSATETDSQTVSVL
jgi:cytochrome c oxidase assembly factor CtaG